MKSLILVLRSIFICFITFLLLLPNSCTLKSSKTRINKTSKILVINYQEFGPPQLTEELLGPSHWQWEKQSNHHPTIYDIKVIVYRDILLQEVKKQYPVIADKKQDYRYIDYLKATEWINKMIIENQKTLIDGAQDLDRDILLYTFSSLENLYKLLLKIEHNLRN